MQHLNEFVAVKHGKTEVNVYAIDKAYKTKHLLCVCSDLTHASFIARALNLICNMESEIECTFMELSYSKTQNFGY